MKRLRFTEQQIALALREAAPGNAGGGGNRKLGVSGRLRDEHLNAELFFALLDDRAKLR